MEMSYSPLISVIVPIYNVEKYLPCCLDSLKNQTYDKLEILLIDDGSTDDSANVCKAYCNDPRFRYFLKKNGGISSARNYGLSVFNGDYVSFVDADDFVDKDLFMAVVTSLNRKKSDIVQFGYSYYYDAKKEKKTKVRRIENGNVLKNYLLFDPDVVWNKVYDKRFFEILRFMDGIIYEDSYILPMIFSQNPCVSTIEEPLYCYRQRNDSIVHSRFDSKKLDFFLATDNLISVIRKNQEELLPLCFFRSMVRTAFLYCQCLNSMDEEKNDHLKYIELKYNEYKSEYKRLSRHGGIKFSWRLEIFLFEINKSLFAEVFR